MNASKPVVGVGGAGTMGRGIAQLFAEAGHEVRLFDTVDGAAVHTMDEARARLSGPVADDVLVGVTRGDRPLTLRVTREAVRR